MSKLKDFLVINADGSLNVEWYMDYPNVGDLFITEESQHLFEYIKDDNGLAELLIIQSDWPDYIGRTRFYNYGRLTKVPQGSSLKTARILYGNKS